MKRSELDRILAQHKLWLESAGSTGKRANLIGADLTDANLAGADLAFADLIDANLTSADLGGANLTNADLTDADLTSANLVGSILNSKWMNRAKVNQSQLSWLATDPNFCDWVDQLDVKKEAA